MARKPSVILTPTEKKIAAAEAKAEVFAARKEVTSLERAQVQAQKEHFARVRDLERAFEAGTKERAKLLKAAHKRLQEAELVHVNLTVPVPAAPFVSTSGAQVV